MYFFRPLLATLSCCLALSTGANAQSALQQDGPLDPLQAAAGRLAISAMCNQALGDQALFDAAYADMVDINLSKTEDRLSEEKLLAIRANMLEPIDDKTLGNPALKVLCKGLHRKLLPDTDLPSSYIQQ